MSRALQKTEPRPAARRQQSTLRRTRRPVQPQSDTQNPPAAQAAQDASGVHPAVIRIALIAAAWFLVTIWISFGASQQGGSDTGLALAVVTLFFAFFLALVLLTASWAASDPRWQQTQTSFRDFLKRDIAVGDTTLRGRDVALAIVLMPVALAAAGTCIGLIWLLTG